MRVSNGSPSLERMVARQAEYPKPSACRNLFGPVNHEELTRDLEKHCRDMEEASQRKWNFDFKNHKPLEGKYEWQEVEKGSLPEFYHRPPRPPKGACKVPAQEGQDASGARPAVPLLGSQANPEDTHLVDQKTDAPDSQTGLAEQCPGIRKRPAADGNDPFRCLKCLSVSVCRAPFPARGSLTAAFFSASSDLAFGAEAGGAHFATLRYMSTCYLFSCLLVCL